MHVGILCKIEKYVRYMCNRKNQLKIEREILFLSLITMEANKIVSTPTIINSKSVGYSEM